MKTPHALRDDMKDLRSRLAWWILRKSGIARWFFTRLASEACFDLENELHREWQLEKWKERVERYRRA